MLQTFSLHGFKQTTHTACASTEIKNVNKQVDVLSSKNQALCDLIYNVLAISVIKSILLRGMSHE